MTAKPLTMQELAEALLVAAQVVEAHGEMYLPHFELLEREYQERQRKGNALERARFIAAQAARVLPHHPAP